MAKYANGRWVLYVEYVVFLFMCDLCLCVCESSMMFRSEPKVFRSSVAGNAMAAEINAAT